MSWYVSYNVLFEVRFRLSVGGGRVIFRGGCLCGDVVRHVCVCVRRCVCDWSVVLSELVVLATVCSFDVWGFGVSVSGGRHACVCVRRCVFGQ